LDWREPADYAFTENLTPTGWAWEFLRRNPEYRADWKAVAAVLKKHGPISKLKPWPPQRGPISKLTNRKLLHFDPPPQNGETVADWYGRCAHTGREPYLGSITVGRARRWGLARMYDPSSDEVGNAKFLSVNPARLVPARDELNDVLLPRPDEFYGFAVYDLSAPLPGQLAWVKRELEGRQRAMRKAGLSVPDPKLFKGKWRDYLRVLDAHLTGEKLGVIGAVLWPWATKNSDPEYRRARARDTLQAAQRMAQIGYRDVLHQKEK
jgi:hypothetical protein